MVTGASRAALLRPRNRRTLAALRRNSGDCEQLGPEHHLVCALTSSAH
jgi:hypothetical protein